MSQRPSFFEELQRRNVFRAGVLYVGAIWAFGQGLSQFSPALGLPDWTTRWFLIAAIVGFPFWIAFAWFYEFTPTGLKRESEIAPDDSIAHSAGRKLDFWIIGIMAIAIVLLVTNQFVLHRDANGMANSANTETIAAELAKLPEKSVAVLPLANESGDSRQQYFSDGLSEELISDLTQIDGLKVIGKYSSFKFRDARKSPAQIGVILGVANLIQGSVRQQGDRIRVTVGLIRAADGISVWSHSYDEQLKDVFAIQALIGRAVAAALQVKLLDTSTVSSDKPPSGNVQAYEYLLQGRALARRGTDTGLHQGIALLQQALQLDPTYAYAWGVLSTTSINLGQQLLGDARHQAYEEARVAADKQQTLAPDSAATHLFRGYLLSVVDNDPQAAVTEYRRALALAPNDGTTTGFLANGLANVGQLQPAIGFYRKAIATDPLRADFYAGLGSALFAQRQLDAAERAIRKALALQPDYPELYSTLAQIEILRGKFASALHDATLETDADSRIWALAAAKQIGPDRRQADAALRDYVARKSGGEPYGVADLYALRKQPDEMFEWLERAWSEHDPNLIESLLLDPFVLAYRNDPRFATLCKQAGLPLPDEAAAPGASSDASAR